MREKRVHLVHALIGCLQLLAEQSKAPVPTSSSTATVSKVTSTTTTSSKSSDYLQQKNDELRDKNYKVMDRVKQLETASQQLLSETEHVMSEQHTQFHTILTLIYPSQKFPTVTQPKNKEEMSKYWEELRTVIEKSQSKQASTAKPSQQSKSNESSMAAENESLQAQVGDYKTALAELLKDLATLEQKAASQESHWAQKCELLEQTVTKHTTTSAASAPATNGSKAVIDKIRTEYEQKVAQMQKEMSSILAVLVPDLPKDKAMPPQDMEPQIYREWLKEVETIVKHTHTTKTITKDVGSHLQTENDRLKKEIATYEQTMNELVRERLGELQGRLSTEEKEHSTLLEQISILKQTLETERSTQRDLSSQAVKLRGMLKVGQDALRHEQQLVSQLRETLKTAQPEL
jgi:chromosome segregation ATPase